ncbi:WXG100 family type VII secretion target [Amycolatopsis jejuensis]|uniref:WXG100 family type VII secretion target n=1 Tax=Amycolatopsis jejuensis TaxID=330084 RepID=UPI000691E79F|nr:WXG100 family type VII secretion target [Amycolatopsis jejuensis]
MTTGFTGTPEQFTAAEGRVVDVRTQMDQQLGKLEGEIEATRAGWEGDAQRAFDNVMRRFDETGKGLNQALADIGHLLQEAGSKYQRSEAQNNEMVQALNKGFNVLG